MSTDSRPATLDATLSHGQRLVVPLALPVGARLFVAALGPGWCELTTQVVPFTIFEALHVHSRQRLLLPRPVRRWWDRRVDGPVLCLVDEARHGATEVLLTSMPHLVGLITCGSYLPPGVNRWTPDESPWLRLREDPPGLLDGRRAIARAVSDRPPRPPYVPDVPSSSGDA